MTAPEITTRKQNVTLGRPSEAPKTVKETTEMLIYEELARARIRDMESAIRAQRARRNARSAQRLSRWLTRRARRHQA